MSMLPELRELRERQRPRLDRRPGRRRPLTRGLLSLATALAVTLAMALALTGGAAAARGPESACGSQPDAPAGADGFDRATAERFVRRLGSGAIAARDAAARGLLDLGPAALPLVASARQAASGARADALERIEWLLGQRAAAHAIEPALVTLQADDVAAGEPLQQLFAQAGSRIELAAATDRRVSLRGDRLTFWEAVDELLDRAGLVLEFVAATRGEAGVRGAEPGMRRPSGNALRIVAAVPGGSVAPAVAAGPLRVSVANVERTGRPQPGEDGLGRGARVTLRMAWEPRLEPLLARLPARSLVAEGPGGEALPAAQRAAVIEATIPPGWTWIDLPLLFGPPAVPLERLGVLRGTIVLWLAGMEHDFRFDGVPVGREAAAVAAPLRVGAVEVRLVDARVVDRRLLVRASVTYDAASEALASHHSWLASRRLEACVAADGPLEQVDERVESRTDRGVTVAAEFAVPPAWADAGDAREVHIRWTLPIAIHELPVDFAIRDVPLAPAPPP
jgi:hypothetical protein